MTGTCLNSGSRSRTARTPSLPPHIRNGSNIRTCGRKISARWTHAIPVDAVSTSNPRCPSSLRYQTRLDKEELAASTRICMDLANQKQRSASPAADHRLLDQGVKYEVKVRIGPRQFPGRTGLRYDSNRIGHD